MCGIYSKILSKNDDKEKLLKRLKIIEHRGGDGIANYQDENVFIGHVRQLK
jgi:asparagine synthetase B (glutamine-hydrolysing)